MGRRHARSERMTGEIARLFAEVGVAEIALLAAVAFVAATVSGMSGVGGGILMAIFIAPVVGVEAVVPTVGVATLIAHVIRVWVYRHHIIWQPALVMLTGALPAVILSARLYVELPADLIATGKCSGCPSSGNAPCTAQPAGPSVDC
jgi:hypothetical protein